MSGRRSDPKDIDRAYVEKASGSAHRHRQGKYRRARSSGYTAQERRDEALKVRDATTRCSVDGCRALAPGDEGAVRPLCTGHRRALETRGVTKRDPMRPGKCNWPTRNGGPGRCRKPEGGCPWHRGMGPAPTDEELLT